MRSSRRHDHDRHDDVHRNHRSRDSYRRSSDYDRSKKPRRDTHRSRRRSRSRSEDRRERIRSRSRSEERRRSKTHHRSKKSSSPMIRKESEAKDKRQKTDHSDTKIELKKTDFAADITPEDIQLMQQMGIPFGFETTQGKHVSDEEANSGAIRAKSLRQARQYMNRKGGFNRPLPAERTGQKVVRD